ncbi:MAG: T9SS type A sorting domain-containing protein, partial [Calditrichales bacterium]|nr:T9SS type A sorting domain-containing protein [Calditrichales bacterium]
ISNVVRDFTPVGIDEEHLNLRIESFALHQNYPNPFNPDTRIKYQVARKGNIHLAVYNVLGQRVQTLLNRIHETGSYSVTFNATGIPSGIYYYKLTAGSLVQVRKMVLIK